MRDVDLNVATGEILVVCGPSGSGKSTMIRCINHLENFQKGHIQVNGITLTSEADSVSAVRREIGMVFQSFNLFPHLSVMDNLTLAPQLVQGVSSAEAKKSAHRSIWSECELPSMRTSTRRNCPAVSSSEWRLPGRCA